MSIDKKINNKKIIIKINAKERRVRKFKKQRKENEQIAYDRKTPKTEE